MERKRLFTSSSILFKGSTRKGTTISVINKKDCKGLLVIMCLLIMSVNFSVRGHAAEKICDKQIFSTWEGFEPDKCASIWLIQRFVSPKAVIKFYPKSDIIKEGIPFDTPNAKLRRYVNKSTFESLLHHYKLADPKLIHIGKIIHDIEINIWERKLMPETFTVIDFINSLLGETTDDQQIIKKGNAFFDDLYQKLDIPGSPPCK
jgi:hypothetical protein